MEEEKMTTNKTTDALLPCPFCGGAARLAAGLGNGEIAYCDNDDCHVRPEVLGYYAPEVVIEMWNARAQPNPAQEDEYIRKDIVPQDQVRAVLSGLDGLMGATFWNTNAAKHEWAEWANKNRDILRALLVAHGGNE